MSPYYQDDAVTIYHGDCRDVLPTLAGVDLIFTSPPYNLGVSSGGGLYSALGNGKWPTSALAHGYGNHDDAMEPAAYIEWQRDCLRLMWAALGPAGAIFYNHKPRVQDGEVQLPTALNPGLPLRQIITWARAGGINYSPSFYMPTYEWIMVLAKPDWRLKSKEASGIGDVWRVAQEPSPHPAPFPLTLVARAVETTSATLLADPFMGSGTVLRAAKDAGRRAIGIEIEERYCEIAAKRCAQEVLSFGAVLGPEAPR